MGYSDFGLRIGVEGEQSFRKSLSEINQSFKVLGSEMNLVTSQFDKQDKSAGALTARNQVLRKEIDAQKDKVETLEAALQNAASSFGENDKRTQAWQIQLNNANAALNGMERELGANETALESTANDLNSAGKQADEFGDEIKQSADQAEDAGGRFDKLGSVVKGIGVALGTAMAAIGTAAIAAGKALIDMTVNTAVYADKMLTQSIITGMSVERLQAYSYAAELVDVSLETLTGSMAKNVKSMSNAAEGSKAYSEAYDRLGVSVTNTDGSLRNSEDVYWDAIDALGQMANETERDALAMQLFGKSAQDLNPLIAEGSKGIAALTDEAKRMGAVLSEETIEKFSAFDDSVQRLKQGAEAAQRVMGTVLLPQLQTLADDGVSLLGDFTSGLAEAGGDFDKITVVLGETVGGIANLILGSLPQFVQVGMSIVSAIGGALAANLPVLISAASGIVMTLLQGVITALPQFTDGAVQLITTLAQGIVDNLPALVEAAIEMIASIVQGIGEALPALIPAIIEAMLLICETLLNNMDKLIAAAFAIVKGLAEGIIRALPKLIEALPKLITGIINFITQNLPMLVTMGIQLTVQLALGLIKAIPQLIAALPQIISALLNGLGQSVSSMVEIGKNIVGGLWDGIKSMASWLASKVRDFFSGIVRSAKKALGISSPSKVFVGIGENMGDSVGVGFTDAMEDVNKQIQSAIPTSVDVGAIDVLTNLPSSIGIGGTSDLLSQKLDILISEVRRYLPQLAGMQLVADTGATIGWLAPAMDDALGAIRRRKERLT
jgi:hypothetical protein